MILLVATWGQRALREEADRGQHHHHHEYGGRKSTRSSPFNIIILRRGHYHPSTCVWQNMWTRRKRAPPVLGTSTSSSHWGWQIEHGSACTSRNQGNSKDCIFKRKGLHWCRKHLFVETFHQKAEMQFLIFLACSWQPLLTKEKEFEIYDFIFCSSILIGIILYSTHEQIVVTFVDKCVF